MPGSIVSEVSSIVAGAYLTIQPAVGTEWGIQTIFHADDINIEFGDGANWIVVDDATGSGIYSRYLFLCTNDHYIRIENNSAGAALIGYTGTVLRVP